MAGQTQDRLVTENEFETRIAIIDAVKEQVIARDFEALNRTADEFRLGRNRTPSGTWKLTYFHGGLSNEIFGADTQSKTCVNHLADFARDWREHDPLHPASYLAEAHAYLDYAWCVRGRGYADQVSFKDSMIFLYNVMIAQEILEKNSEIASLDPHYYALLISIYKASGTDIGSFHSLLLEGVEQEPEYYATYFEAAQYLLPRWHGSREAVAELANFATRVTEAKEGQSLYARIYWALGGLDGVSRTMFEWERVVAGMHDVMERYPDRWNAMSFARMACQKAKLGTATTFYEMLGEDVSAPKEIEEPRWLREWNGCVELMQFQAEALSRAGALGRLGK